MLGTKIFEAASLYTLEDALNSFLSRSSNVIEVKQVSYSHTATTYSALVLYERK